MRLAAEPQATGLHWIREDLSWSELEPQPNRFDFRRYDELVLFAAQRGITVLPLIDETPRWAAASPQALPSDPASFASFATAAAQRYALTAHSGERIQRCPRIRRRWFELYNEPYLDGRDPGAYARLVRATVQAAPAVHFISGRHCRRLDRRDVRSRPGSLPLRIGGRGAFLLDATPDAPPSPDSTRRLELVHETMAAHGDGSVPIWITEIGWSTCPASSDCVPSETVQAEYLARTLELAETQWSSYVRALFVFGLRDLDSQRPDDKESWFGVVRRDGSPKPAWRVLAAAARG